MRNFFTILSMLCLTLAGCQSPKPIERKPVVSKPIKVEKIEAVKPQGGPKVKVALLLPLSGEHHTLGTDLQNAAQMCMFENSGNNIELIMLDTKGESGTAVAQGRAAIEQGAKLFIGPVFSKEVTAIKQIAQPYSIPVISLSNDQNVAQAPVFTFGFGLKDQIWKLVNVARKHGIESVGALVPQSEYGNLVRSELERAAQFNSMSKPFVATYGSGNNFAGLVKQFNGAGVKAIIIPEGGAKLRELITGLTAAGLTGVRFMGTGQWDTPDVNLDKTLQGGWFVASPIAPRLNFESRYERTFGKTPQRIATLAYDAVSIAIKATQGGQVDTSLITDPRGFSGVDGVFRLLPDGHVERDLIVYEIAASGLKKIS